MRIVVEKAVLPDKVISCAFKGEDVTRVIINGKEDCYGKDEEKSRRKIRETDNNRS